MGALDSLYNNALAQYGLGIQQQQINYGQWQQTAYTTAATTAATITVDGYVYGDAPKKKKGPESALEWLDRRVDEMRITL